MNRRRSLAAGAAAIVVLLGACFWWRHGRSARFDKLPEFMHEMRRLHESVAREVARPELTPEFADMERLTQTAQDLLPALRRDPHGADPRAGPLATELMRNATKLEHAWEANNIADARTAFFQLTNACNECHTKTAHGKPPTIEVHPSSVAPRGG